MIVKSRKERLASALASGLLLCAASNANATVITVFTDKTQWLAATSSATTEDFEDTTLAVGLTSITGGGIVNSAIPCAGVGRRHRRCHVRHRH